MTGKYYVKYKLTKDDHTVFNGMDGIDVHDVEDLDAIGIINYIELELDNSRNYGDVIEIESISKL